MWRYRWVSSAGRHPKTNDSCVTAAGKWRRASVGATPPSHVGVGGLHSSLYLWVMLCVRDLAVGGGGS